ncbi:hypothetical protein FQA39_LY02961 [Lamprigera yunnana]|nr:hypothetical protein FQA39_LY02961 [Lamprigera yunnana]
MNKSTNSLCCLICNNTMSPPMKKCSKGHSFCGNCISNSKCILCQSPVELVTYQELEDFIAKLKEVNLTVPCCYTNRGCKYELLSKEMESHKLECKHRTYLCEGYKYCGWKCKWEGGFDEILNHFKIVHNCGMNYKFEGALKINFKKSGKSIEPIDYSDGYALFWYKSKIDVENEMIFWAIQYVGLKKHAQHYYYEFEIYDGPVRKLKVTEICDNDSVDSDTLFESEKCVALSFTTARNFLNSKGYVTFRFRIMKQRRESANSNEGQEPVSSKNPVLRKGATNITVCGDNHKPSDNNQYSKREHLNFDHRPSSFGRDPKLPNYRYLSRVNK